MKNKPAFTEEEIDQLQDLQGTWEYGCGISDSIRAIEEMNCSYKDIPSFVFLIKKKLKELEHKHRTNYQEKWTESTLDIKLLERMEWTEKNKPKES